MFWLGHNSSFACGISNRFYDETIIIQLTSECNSHMKYILSISAFLFILSISMSGQSWTTLPKQAEELGYVNCNRSYDDAIEMSKKINKPVFILFQEVPGCSTCRNYGISLNILHIYKNGKRISDSRINKFFCFVPLEIIFFQTVPVYSCLFRFVPVLFFFLNSFQSQFFLLP